jgi:hypothetical protein
LTGDRFLTMAVGTRGGRPRMGRKSLHTPANDDTADSGSETHRSAASVTHRVPGPARDAGLILHAYLPYSYGRGDADRIRGAAPPLVRALHDAPPRVPTAVARGRPRLVSVLAQAATGDRDVLVFAAVDDGRRRYDVRLTVHRGADRWVVTEISG